MLPPAQQQSETMARWFLGAALVGALLCPAVTGHAQQRAPRPYAVHEFRLGISLAEFRKIPRLTEPPSENVEQTLVCSTDAKSSDVDKMQPNPDLKEAGAIKCGLFAAKAGDQPVIGSLDLFGERTECEFLFYRAKNDTEFRLAQITLSF